MDAVSNPTTDAVTASHPPGTATPTPFDRVARWTTTYQLSTAEVEQLNAVRENYPADEVDAELLEELRCVLAARQLAAMPQLTADQVTRAREAFEAGRTPFVAQHVD